MSTGPTTLPASGDAAPKNGGRLPRLRDARIRSKLALILVVPVAAVIALATVRLVSVGEGAYDASQARALTALSIDVSALTNELHAERMAAAAFLAAPQQRADAYNLRVRETQQRIDEYRAERAEIDDAPAAVRDRLAAIDAHLDTLDGTRQEVLARQQMEVAEAALRYGVVLNDLVAYGDGLAQLPGDEELGDTRRAVAAFARAKAAVAEEEAVAFTALSAGRLDNEQFSSFVATLTGQQEALVAFSLAADPAQRALVESTVSGDAVVLADRIATDLTRSVNQRAPFTAQEATAAIGAVNELMRWAEIELQSRLLDQAEQARSDVIQQAVVETTLVLLTLIIAVTLAVVLARSLNHSLRRLREGALSVANHDLPEAVRRLQGMGNVSDGSVDEIVREVRDPIQLNNRDEVGQVALAFNVVHREAVRVAAEQAALRTSVSAMFLNLARRSQTLVDRMIGELDAIERGEEDPKRLAQLFELDHLATRMRRNDENLLVLAGADSAVPRRDDALLVDVLRAAQSEVELYNRIEFGTVDTDVSVAAHAVNDVVRLVAELLDNATRFSPPNTTVVADGRRIRDYVLIQIEDRGLGLTDEQLDSLNRRLSAPSTVDVAAFRLMGLAVVSRLAARYGIRVELRRNVEGGTVAQVTLPAATVVLPSLRGRDQAITRPRQPLAVEQPPLASVGLGDPAGATGRGSTATLVDRWHNGTSSGPTWPGTGPPRRTRRRPVHRRPPSADSTRVRRLSRNPPWTRCRAGVPATTARPPRPGCRWDRSRVRGWPHLRDSRRPPASNPAVPVSTAPGSVGWAPAWPPPLHPRRGRSPSHPSRPPKRPSSGRWRRSGSGRTATTSPRSSAGPSSTNRPRSRPPGHRRPRSSRPGDGVRCRPVRRVRLPPRRPRRHRRGRPVRPPPHRPRRHRRTLPRPSARPVRRRARRRPRPRRHHRPRHRSPPGPKRVNRRTTPGGRRPTRAGHGPVGRPSPPRRYDPVGAAGAGAPGTARAGWHRATRRA
ncbi:hypothetical protein GCM10029963_56930 [Micromonospora andamanensis]